MPGVYEELKALGLSDEASSCLQTGVNQTPGFLGEHPKISTNLNSKSPVFRSFIDLKAMVMR